MHVADHGYLVWTGWLSYQPLQPSLPSRQDSCSPLLQISPEFQAYIIRWRACHFLPSFPSVGQFCRRWACCLIHPSSSAFPSWPPPFIQFEMTLQNDIVFLIGLNDEIIKSSATFFLKLLSGSEVSRSSENLFGFPRSSPANWTKEFTYKFLKSRYPEIVTFICIVTANTEL